MVPPAFTLLSLALSAATTPTRPSAMPQTINLRSRQASHVARRGLSPIEIPLKDYFNGTDLQWFGDIQVGTPPQTISVIFDTGSPTLEFASTQCGAPCKNQIQFDSSKSTTFVDGGHTANFTFATGTGVDPVIGNNWQLTLRSATDTVAIGNVSVPSVSLFLIIDQTPTFASAPFSGVLGLSTQASGLFAGLEQQGLPPLFSFFVTPNSVGNAELTLGGIDDSKFNGSLIFANLTDPDSGGWQLTSSYITVNGKSSPALKKSRAFIFDSGTSNVVMPQADAEAIYAQISPDIKPNPDEAGTYGIACECIPTLPAEISFTFSSQEGVPFTLTIPSSELSVGPFRNNPALCQTLINAVEEFSILGGSLLKHYYSVWDLGGSRLGFAPNGI